MSEFATYRPDVRRRPLDEDELRVRPAAPKDADVVARITAEREGLEGADLLALQHRIRREIRAMRSGEASLLLVARLAGEVVGFGRAGLLESLEAPVEGMPEGWYLLGVIVERSHRRRGIAEALTRARIAWVRERAPHVYYFSNVANRASIDLHARLGFRELTRDFHYPRGGPTRGQGILFVLDLDGSS